MSFTLLLRIRKLIGLRFTAGLLLLAFLIVTVISPGGGLAAPLSQEDSSEARALALLESPLTPEERVGQLFLVTFNGTDVDAESQIYDLIVNHHIGGVILQNENDNFLPAAQTINGIWQLVRDLQTVEWTASQSNQFDVRTGQEFTPAFIPLFVGISQEGNGPPYDQIFNGLTPLPSAMALGATWQPDLARQVGAVEGSELAALGINLLLSPSLDVLETPRETSSGDLGVRTFGGDPYWVGEFGKAFVTGIHEGSDNRIAVIAKHFPGHGASDRLPEAEVATVRKSLEQLKQIELPPFYSVTGNAPTSEATIDGLLVSHIRYQGFQGNIRETTRPVSLEKQALDQLLNLPPINTWRQNGGIIVSDNLGSRAFKKFADPTGQNFQARFIARDAFLAGNDLLFLGNEFIATADQDSYSTIIRTLDFFAQKYRDDPAFQEKVDQSVLKILALKYRLYKDIFTLNQVIPPQDGLEKIGEANQIPFQVAQQAVTLISPSLSELANTIPEGPNINDRIVFISDTRVAKQCNSCPEQIIFGDTAFQNAVIRLYGPLAGGQVLQRNLFSYSFQNLLALLDRSPQIDYTILEADLQRAQWIVFAMLNASIDNPSSQALARFLAERPDLFRQKNLIVFAFDAPYFLDATEISKLSAYYALYSKIPQFIDVAARVLFGEIPSPPGNLPVSVPGIDYDLISATAPDPDQTIQLSLDIPQPSISLPEPTDVPQFVIGDLIPVKTGVILDHNGHPVPDGTPVQFVMSIGEVEVTTQTEVTKGGIARTTLLIEQSGNLSIRARSDPATNSAVLQVDVAPAILLPTQSPSPQPETPTATFEIIQTPTLAATETPPATQSDSTKFSDWLIATLSTIGLVIGIYWLTTTFSVLRWAVRAALLSLIGGTLAYTYWMIKLPGSNQLTSTTGRWGVIAVTLIGVGIGWGAALSWQRIHTFIRKRNSAH